MDKSSIVNPGGMLFFFQLPAYLIIVIIFCLIVLVNWLGYRYKKGQIKRHPGRIQESMGSIESSMVGVMSLLLGFSFSVAVSKFEARRQLLVEEANTIGTAIMRCDMYPDTIRTALREDFKQYLESRIAYYRAGYGEEKKKDEIRESEKISGRIWESVTYYSNNADFRIRSQQMIPILNNMIDVARTGDAMRISKVPPLILWTLVFLVLIAAFVLGSDYKGNKRNIMLSWAYALVMTLTLNLINELNHPRQGLINLDDMERKMEDLRSFF